MKSSNCRWFQAGYDGHVISAGKQVAHDVVKIEGDRRAEIERLVQEIVRVALESAELTGAMTLTVTSPDREFTLYVNAPEPTGVQGTAIQMRASTPLRAMTEEFDALLARMQAPGARQRMQEAFDAEPVELGEAAVNAARRHG